MDARAECLCRMVARANAVRSRVTNICALVLCLLMLGCGGSSGNGNQGGNPSPQPAFTTIDAPGAGTVASEGTFGVGISTQGDVIGNFIDSNGVVHGFIRDASGTITTVDAAGAATAQGSGTEVWGMNGSGEATGYYYDPSNTPHSFLVSANGTMTEFDPPNSTGSYAICINDSGVIAGGTGDANGIHGFTRTADGTFTSFDPTGDAAQVTSVEPNSINASGVMAGVYLDTNSVYHAFVGESSGNLTTFDAPNAGTASGEGTQAIGINSSGTVAGWVTTGVANGLPVNHSFMRSTDGTITTFDPPAAGANGSLADGINDDGTISGAFIDSNLVRHGYVRNTDGSFVVLDDPNAAQLPASSSTNLDTVAWRINASGAVAGLYSDTNGVRHGFLWQ